MTVTRIAKVDPHSPDHHILKEAAHIISEGGLVIIPTETVYGIAADMMNVQAQARLYEIKQRPKDKPFAVLIEEKLRIEEFALRAPTSAYKLIEKFWPGPLTIVLKYKHGGTIGLRMPDHEVARWVVKHTRIPFVCPSANISGKPAPVDFPQAMYDLDGLVDFAIDAGPAQVGLESTVVDLSVEPAKVLREGAIKKEDIESVINKKFILFVCTGNSCRSVMAAAYMEKVLRDNKRSDVEVASAGILILGGIGATAGTKEVLKKEGIDVSGHHAQRMTREMVKKSDLILVMEKIHEDHVLHMAPEVQNRLFLLKEFAKIEDNDLAVHDPIGKPLQSYEETFAVIREAVKKVSELI
jgi:tRNA threonylcarbamoyl adenosine modification protein (Sua5/YciO/YrdC/YwlC family)